MAYSPRRGAIYTHGKPPLPPSALKRSPTRKQAPYVQKIDVIDADTLRAVTDSLSSPPPDSLPPAVAVDQSFQPKSIAPPFPPPPPLCPAAPKFTSEPSTSPLKLPSREFVVRSSNQHVAREVVQAWDTMFTEALGADVVVSTDDGGSFPAHSHVLASGSPVWKVLFQQKRPRRRGHVILIPGVPCDAGKAFIRFLYSSRCKEEDMRKYAMHLLVLSHAYCVPGLKAACTRRFKNGMLNAENVTDVLQLARLCDAPGLNLWCIRFIVSNFKLVARSEGWRAMKTYDPSLEQELVEAVIEFDTKKQEKIRKKEEGKVYAQLHEAMVALVHICRDGCRTIGPHDKASDEKKGSTCDLPACKGLESLVRHFASCKVKVSGGCFHCKRMWQLLELHSRMCHETISCKVPLCSHFKIRVGLRANKKEETRWRLLVGKILAAKEIASTFSLAAVSAREPVQTRTVDLDDEYSKPTQVKEAEKPNGFAVDGVDPNPS